MFLKEMIKKLVPEMILESVRSHNRAKSLLFCERDFISYVYRKKVGLEKNLETISTLVLRGSHADYGFFTEGQDYTYNLGLTSSDLYFNFKLYEKYSQRMPNLDTVIIFFSVFTPGLSLIKTREKYRLVTYKHFFDIPYQDEKSIDLKLERKILKKCRALREPTISSNYFGYEFKKDYFPNITPEQRTKTHLRENKRLPNQLEWLVKLNTMVSRDNRRLIVVIPPTQKAYVEHLPDKSELFGSLNTLGIDEKNIVDFYDSSLFEDSDLGDLDHLNDKGARKLTKELLKIIREPVAQK